MKLIPQNPFISHVSLRSVDCNWRSISVHCDLIFQLNRTVLIPPFNFFSQNWNKNFQNFRARILPNFLQRLKVIFTGDIKIVHHLGEKWGLRSSGVINSVPVWHVTNLLHQVFKIKKDIINDRV